MKVSRIPLRARHGARTVACLAFAAAGLLAGRVAAQESTAIFDLPVVVAPPSTDFRALADLDGDGRKEAISINFPNSTTIVVQAWRFGTTAPTLGWQATYTGIIPVGALATTIAVGDFNGDGREDFALSLNNSIGWWFSNGATVAPTVLWVLARPSGIRSMIAADFDGDGRADLAALDSTDIEVFITPTVGIPTVTSSAVAPPFLTSGVSLFNLDGNADGLPDVGVFGVSAPGNVGAVRIHPVIGGVIGAPTIITPIFGPAALPVPMAGDIDGDGDEDITIFGAASHATLRRTGPTSFNVEPAVPGKVASVLADIDGDGRLDAVGYVPTNLGQPTFIDGGSQGFIYIHRNDGSGNFLAPERVEAVGWSTLAGVADLDGDGDEDIVAGRCVRWTHQPASMPINLTPAISQFPWTPADFDRDGDPDLALRVDTSGAPLVTTLTMVRNEGDGTFVTAPIPFLGATPQFYGGPGIQGDFDGDGDLDVLCLYATSISATSAVAHLLRNLGGGTLVDDGPAAAGPQYPWLPFQTGFYYYVHQLSAVVADVDLDGDMDIVLRSWVTQGGYSGGESVVWLNSGTGFFTALPPISGAEVLEIADFDGDQVPDALAVISFGSSGPNGALKVLHGNGNGTFGSATTIPIAFDFRFRVAVADVDGDGDLDIGYANQANLGLLRNQGNGTFAVTTLADTLAVNQPSSSNTSPPETLNQAFLVDVNGDGLLDLVGGPLAGAPNAMAICLATAPGDFSQPIIQPVIATSFVDLDGDGDLDAITRNGAFLGNRLHGPTAGLRTQHGVGLAGSQGVEPIIGDEGPFRTGVSGAVHITNGLGGAPGWLILSTATTSVPVLGGLLQVSPDVLLPIELGGVLGSAGTGSLTLPWTMPPGFEGVTLHHQAAFIDPGAPQGVSFTRVLSVTIGS